MPSNINVAPINENFPIAGIDNRSQTFRDNFNYIKTALSTAKSEITNLIDNPQVPTKLSTLENDAGFVTSTDLEEVVSTFPNLGSINTDDIAEGSDNLFFTTNRFNEAFETAYQNEVTGQSITINKSSILTTAVVASPSTLVNQIRLTNISEIEFFKSGQNLRIFGASVNDVTVPPVNDPAIALTIGSITGNIAVRYKIAQFDFSTGKISNANAESNEVLVNTDNFNSKNNVKVSFTRTSINHGILIYRKTGTGAYQLISILGTKELTTSLQSSYTDYFTFDYSTWSKKDPVRNEYSVNTGTIHFPLSPPTGSIRGWVDVSITSVNQTTGSITLSDSILCNSTITIVHDDTEYLRSQIQLSITRSHRILELDSRDYYVSSLAIPDNFAIRGKSSKSKIIKLPWSSSTAASNRIIKSINEIATGIYIKDVQIDGNMQNQYLIDDGDISLNYAVSLSGKSISADHVILTNTIGGGLLSNQSTNLFITNSTIENSGMTDRYNASPIYASSGSEVIITNNLLKNFSDAFDASTTSVGVISSNIVKNCGSGILTFGSTKLSSSNNLILGPADEYIPGPDVFNSEYDAVNITIQSGIPYISDVYVYQENGNIVDLSDGDIAYQVFKLQKVNNVEELYGDEVKMPVTNSSPLSDRIITSLGAFQFYISGEHTTLLKSNEEGGFGYSILKSNNEYHMGLIYRAIFTGYPALTKVNTTVPVDITTPILGYVFCIEIGIDSVSNLSVGTKVKLKNTGLMDNQIGTVIKINKISKTCEIGYSTTPLNPSTTLTAGDLCIENTYVLAKGKIL